MWRRVLILAALAMLNCPEAFGAEVIGVSSNRKAIAVKHENIGKWAVDDRVCVVQAKIDVVCGTVSKTTSKGAIVKLDTTFDGLAIGDLVRKSGSSRRLASESVETMDARHHPRHFNLSAGLGVGPNFFFPLVHFQVAVAAPVAIGFEPVYFKGSSTGSSVTAYGGFGTLNVYLSKWFRGLWFQGGGGVQSISYEDATVVESALVPAFLLTAGWRGRWGQSLNVGIGGGFQYLVDPDFTSIAVRGAGFQPLLVVDFGFNF